MARFKYIKRGVKRQHNIIEGALDILEQIAKIEGVKKVVPAVISYSPVRGIEEPYIRFQRETISGFKLSAHGRGAIQDIYVYVEGSKRKDAEIKLKEICK